MYRIIRMRRFNGQSGKFDYLFPQTVTENILRTEDGGVLEADLLQYDRHLENPIVHINRALSDGTARALSVRLRKKVLTDGFPLLLTLHVGLECEPTLAFNGGDPHPIISASGDRIPGGQAEGTAIFLVWSERLQSWILLSADNFTDVTKVVLPVESEYVYQAQSDGETIIVIPGFNKRADKLTVNFGQTILRAGMEYEYVKNANNTIKLSGFSLEQGDILHFLITTYITTAKRGHFRYELKATNHVVTIEEDNTTEIKIPPEADGAHSIVINYNQTILRNNLDYEYNDIGDRIIMKSFPFNKGDQVTFTITQFVEAPGELVPNNWGATGNYRYKLNILHESYKATEDNITVIPVPNYNMLRDDLFVVKDNQMYVRDVDYTIDEIGNVVLLQTQLNTDDEIFFTILQGAMADVPNFNVIKANGWDGQHIILDMSYSVLCNFYVLLIQLKHDLKTAPTIKCVDGPAEPVCDCFHTPIQGGYKKGSFLWVVYSEPEHLWYSLSHSQLDISKLIPQHVHATGTANFSGKDIATGEYHETVIEHGLGMKPERIDITPCEPPDEGTEIGDIWSYADDTKLYVGNSGASTSKFNWAVTTEEATNDLRTYIDKTVEELKARPGTLITHLSTYTAEDNEIAEIHNIRDFHAGLDKIIVNYNQTILQQNRDYVIDTANNGIRLISFSLYEGDILQFTILSQADD
ncbi:hypothetical protein [uncultured Duncaniella sp.]|uniref:hypothetical protein n=1 Tax=uncultured Duncaniella sp. TaxID=2768039 RepID=UPI002601DE55|nr:hypothetical protein [uncultured Duncaniella sp.]